MNRQRASRHAPFRLALFAAAGLSLAACQTNELPPWFRGGEPEKTPAAAPPPALPPVIAARPPEPQIPPGPAPGGPENVERSELEEPKLAELTPPEEQIRVPGERITLVPPAAIGETVNVALLLPLSGPSAAAGQALLNAAQIALFDIATEQLQMMPIDTKGTPEGAAQAAAEAAARGARLIVGPLFNSEARAVAPVARANGIRVVAFTSDRSAAGNGIYQIGVAPRLQVDRVVAYARTRGVERFAALAPADEGGRLMVEAYRQAVAAQGGTLVQTEFYDPQSGDFTDVVKRLAHYEIRRKALLEQRKELASKDDEISKQALKRLEGRDTLGDVPYEGLFIPDHGGRLRNVAALLPYYDIDPNRVKILGTMLWDEERQIAAEPALVGGWYAAPPPAKRAKYEQDYQNLYGQKAPRIASFAYDGIALAAVLARLGDFGPEALTAPNGYDGVDGIFRLKGDGTSERGLAVLEVQRAQARIVSPAPRGFLHSN